MKKLSRRRFLTLSGVSATGFILSSTGCTISQPAPAKTETPLNAAEVPAATEAPAATETPVVAEPAAAPMEQPAAVEQPATATLPSEKSKRQPEIIRFYPQQKSQVVRARSAAVWTGDTLDAVVIRGMLSRSITSLTGLPDEKQAWQALFKPEERIVLKVNAFRNSLIWTHVPLVRAITDALQEAGIPGEQITIFDYFTTELEKAGFPVNKDGPGVRCYGSDTGYQSSVQVGNSTVHISDILVEADALINIPVLKSHMIAGLTFALKNHYGSIDYPEALHNMKNCLGALNALPQIKDITRLVVGDALEANTKYKNSFPYWEADARGDSILMSYDPLAMDRVGLDLLVEMAEAHGNSTTGILGMCDRWLGECDAAGIGTCNPEQIEVIEV